MLIATVTTKVEYEFSINGVVLSRFTRGETFHGMVEFTRKNHGVKEYLIVDMEEDNLVKRLFEVVFEKDQDRTNKGVVIKASPSILDYVKSELEDNK